VREYLHDLESMQKKDNNNVMIMDENMTPSFSYNSLQGRTKNQVHGYQMSGINTFVKEFTSDDHAFSDKWTLPAVSEIVISNVYNDLGVNSALSYPINVDSYVSTNDKTKKFISPAYATVSEDVCSLKGLDVAIARNQDFLKFLKPAKLMGKFRYKLAGGDMWKVILNPKVKSELLKYMTEDCYNDFVNLYLLGVFSGNYDRNPGNLFFYKTKSGAKWEGLITIDHELTLSTDCIKRYLNQYNTTVPAKVLVNDFFDTLTCFWTPQGSVNYDAHSVRLYKLKKTLAEGKFQDAQLELIDRIKEYDISTTMRHFYDKYNITGTYPTKLYDVTSYAWEKSKDIMLR